MASMAAAASALARMQEAGYAVAAKRRLLVAELKGPARRLHNLLTAKIVKRKGESKAEWKDQATERAASQPPGQRLARDLALPVVTEGFRSTAVVTGGRGKL